MSEIRTWDIGDPEPDGMDEILDYTADTTDPSGDGVNNPRWAKSTSGDWKGYKDGKVYLSWAELVRRWGPARERREGDSW